MLAGVIGGVGLGRPGASTEWYSDGSRISVSWARRWRASRNSGVCGFSTVRGHPCVKVGKVRRGVFPHELLAVRGSSAHH
jgi:hypothetical protein